MSENNGQAKDDFRLGVDKILNIDLNQLEKEWAEHPRHFFALELATVEAERNESQAKADLELIKAQLAKRIRKDPTRFSLARVSEAAIDSIVVTLSPYQEASEAHIKAKYELGICRAAVRMMEHRKKALEKSVDLLLAGFFAVPHASGDAREHLDEDSKQRTRRPIPRKKK